MGKIDENKRKKKEALFNTAYELFTTKGITSTTISDICLLYTSDAADE